MTMLRAHTMVRMFIMRFPITMAVLSIIMAVLSIIMVVLFITMVVLFIIMMSHMFSFIMMRILMAVVMMLVRHGLSELF
jgi:hypothetical protein